MGPRISKITCHDSTFDTDDVVTFSVYGDGKFLATSRPARFGQAAKISRANIAGVKIVELVARGKTVRNKVPSVVNWGNAALLNH